jgi:hypothetical protein
MSARAGRVTSNTEHARPEGNGDTMTQQDILDAAYQCDGIEVHEMDWLEAGQLVEQGLAVLGPARGPDQEWKRLELTDAGYKLYLDKKP